MTSHGKNGFADVLKGMALKTGRAGWFIQLGEPQLITEVLKSGETSPAESKRWQREKDSTPIAGSEMNKAMRKNQKDASRS